MVARKKKSTRKKVPYKRNNKKNSRSKYTNKMTAAHKRATEKMLLVAFVSVLVVAFVVWFSQDFPAEGQAYRMQLELESKQDIALKVATSCQTKDSCLYVKTVADTLGDLDVTLNRVKVDPYSLVYYLGDGSLAEGMHKNFLDDGVRTVSYKGNRYPIEKLSIS